MNILPIKFLTADDKDLFGVDLVNLAILGRAGLPVPSGIVVLPLVLLDQGLLGDPFSSLKKAIDIFPLPKELDQELKFAKEYYFAGETFKSKETLWKKLLETWLEEARFKYHRQGQDLASVKLLPQTIFFLKGNYRELPMDQEKAEKLTRQVNSQMLIPQRIRLVSNQKDVWLVGISPVDGVIQAVSFQSSEPAEKLLAEPEKKIIPKSVLKIYSEVVAGDENDDLDWLGGFLVKGEKWPGFDELVIFVSQLHLINPDIEIIYCLPNISDREKISGCLRLLHQQALLENSTKAINFLRDKKGVKNLSLALPPARSPMEASQIIKKKDKYYLEMGLIENFLNLDEYLKLGLEGIILNLDLLTTNLLGISEEEKRYYPLSKDLIIRFLQTYIDKIKKSKLKVLISGKLIKEPEILEFFIKNGLDGVIAENITEAQSLPEYLRFLENWVIRKL